MTKWLAGLAATILGAIVVFYLTRPDGPLNPVDDDCVIRGSVHEAAAPHDPLANTVVTYIGADGQSSELARTSPDGGFQGTCPERRAFPIAFQVDRSNWSNPIATDIAMREDATATLVNLYIDTDFATLAIEDRLRLEQVAGYSPVYVLADEDSAATVQLTAPENLLINSVGAIDNRLTLPDAMRLQNLDSFNPPIFRE